MVVNPAVLSFGTVTVGQMSPSQTVTVSNDGATMLMGLTFQVAGDYSLSQNGCGTQLASGAMCTLAATFFTFGPGNEDRDGDDPVDHPPDSRGSGRAYRNRPAHGATGGDAAPS